MTITLPTGFSQAAETLDRVRECEAKRRDETVTFSKQPLFDQLIDVFQECSQPGWEGADSEAVDRQTLMIAKQLVEALPAAYRTPTITGEPDTRLTVSEWSRFMFQNRDRST